MFDRENGGNPNYAGRHTKNNVLKFAVIQNDMELVQKLMEEYRFSIKVDRGNDKTAMYYAKQLGYAEMVKYLSYFEEDTSGGVEIPCLIL